MRNKNNRAGNLLASAIAAIIANGCCNMAVAQGVPAQRETAGNVEEISITGSRIRQTGMQTPTPVTSLEAEELELLSPGTLMDQLDLLPQFVNNNTLENASGWTQTGGQSTLNLRGVGGNRTLVLLDGRRIVPSNRLSTVDTNMFPQALIKRTEVVTGGASAAYGSDAISGVVNFILDTDFEGFSANVQAGISDLSDREVGRYSMAGGFDLGERAHIVLGGEYYGAKGIADYDGRDWYQSWGDINYGATRGVPNRTPQRIRSANVYSRTYTLGGLIATGPLAGTQILDNGTPAPFVDGSIMDFTATSALARKEVNGSHVVAPGSRGTGDDIALESQVLAPQDRGNLFAHLKYNLSDDTELSLQAIYGKGTVKARKAGYIFNRALEQITIYDDNAFLPESIRQQMVEKKISSFVLSKQVSPADSLNNSGEGAPQTTTMLSLTAALDGTIGDTGWDYTAYYQYGESLRNLRLYGHRNDRTWRAIDSIKDPATGRIICRSTLSVPNDGCAPLNMFGRNQESQQARDYLHSGAFTHTNLYQHAAELMINGSPLTLWAGPLSVATGISYRMDELDQIGCDVAGCPIPIVGSGPVRTPLDANGKPIYRGLPAAQVGRQTMDLTTGALIKGSFNVKEAFAEVQMPLLREVPFAQSVDMNVAARYAEYQGSGGIWAWKAGLDWQVYDDLRLRVTKSRDIRAASLAERYDVSTGGGNVTDPFLNDAVYIVSTMQGGNPEVEPEYADTLTYGFVYQPSWLPSVSASVDMYDIKLTNAISLLGLADIVNECFRVGAFCDKINRDASGMIQTVRNIYINLDQTRTTGMDVELQYRDDINLFGGGENIRLRAIASHLSEVSIDPYIGPKIDNVGVNDNADWRVTLSAVYNRGPLSLAWTENWRSKVKRDRLWVTGIDVDNSEIASQSLSNLRATYNMDKISVYGSINNIFDRNPSDAKGLNSIYDVIGRNYTVGMNYRY
jgi:iron complex outermembrane receptor protein